MRETVTDNPFLLTLLHRFLSHRHLNCLPGCPERWIIVSGVRLLLTQPLLGVLVLATFRSKPQNIVRLAPSTFLLGIHVIPIRLDNKSGCTVLPNIKAAHGAYTEAFDMIGEKSQQTALPLRLGEPPLWGTLITAPNLFHGNLDRSPHSCITIQGRQDPIPTRMKTSSFCCSINEAVEQTAALRGRCLMHLKYDLCKIKQVLRFLHISTHPWQAGASFKTS